MSYEVPVDLDHMTWLYSVTIEIITVNKNDDDNNNKKKVMTMMVVLAVIRFDWMMELAAVVFVDSVTRMGPPCALNNAN